MQSRIDSWAKKGGKTEKLWESVKHAEKREGVVVCTVEPELDTDVCAKMEVDGEDVKPAPPPPPTPKRVVQPPVKSKRARETERLNDLLESVIKLREEIKRGMEAVIWRERLLQLASERAEIVGQCGWDQRLCLDDEEWADVGAGVLESYEDIKAESAKEDGAEGEMDLDGSEEQWWCPGQKVCDRHQGHVFSFFHV
jgi:COMPASS component SPP1